MAAVSDRGRQKIIDAASRVDVGSDYDAAILGGIVRSLIDLGQINMHVVRQYVPQALGWFDGTRRTTHYLTSAERHTQYMPTSRALPAVERIQNVSRLLIAQYEPKGTDK